MVASSQESASSPPQLKVRKRTDTKTLLGDDYQDIIKDVSPPPTPSQNTLDYKEKNLKERLIYADRTLRDPERKLSPIGICALKLYKDACARLLDLEEGEDYEGGEEELETAKDEWRATIRMYEGSISSPSQLKMRKRTDTKTLLGDDYQDIVRNVPPPPQPSQNTLDYKEKNLKERLIYADRTLRNPERKLSPIGIRALKLYKDACARLLDLEEGEDYEGGEEELETAKDEWRATMRMYEGFIQYTACLRLTRTSDAQMLQDQLLNLQRTAFHARYGDIFAEVCRQLRKEAEIKKVDGWRELQKEYWTEINKKLEKEKQAYERVLKGERVHDQCPTYLAISHTCMRVGFNMDDMLQIIHLYAVRNELVHANFIPLIKKGLFDDLKKQLYNDSCDIPLITSDAEQIQTALMMKLLETIIDLWFNRDQDDPDNYQMWTPTEQLKGYYMSLRGPNPQDEVSLQKDISATIVKRVRKRLREAEQEKEIVEMLSKEFGLVSGKKKIKRVASSQLQAESDRAKLMKGDWAKIMNLVQGVRKISDTYLQSYGELGAPPEIVMDPSLDD